MKKMLAKAIALSVIVGGMSFVANAAQAAVKVESGVSGVLVTDNTGKYVLAEKKDVNGVVTKANQAVKSEETARKAADKKLDKKIEKETKARKAADKKLDKKIEKETKDRKDADAFLDKEIQEEADVRWQGDEQLQANIELEVENRKAADNAEKQARIEADEKEAATRAAEDQRIEAKFDGEVARLDSRIDKLDKKIEKVGAMAAAIANLHTMGYDPAAPTEIAVGVGQYRDKTGVALGAFHYPNRDFMLSFSVSTAGDEYMGGIGATWKFGRKTPEEMRQAEHEKAVKAKVAKAEAAKKAAKDARVAAQQQRHAEMLAARTAK